MIGTNERGLRGMHDADGPAVARVFYERLLESDEITADDVPYALDAAVQELKKTGAPPNRWAPFVHFGA
jgi:hypothetical protein